MKIVRGDVSSLTVDDVARLFDRGSASDPSIAQTVVSIIDDVRARGDDALRDMAFRFDGARMDGFEVSIEQCMEALATLDPDVVAALEAAAASIRIFHEAQLPEDLEMEVRPGVVLGRRAEPLDRVGVYAPGGRAAYPSSVLMGVVPARVAGVREVVVCTPPDSNGLPSQVVLAACAIAGADRIFAVGGAGAIAALALGTASIPAVARITGPGNAYVAEAKRQLTGSVSIDSPAGPSEVLIIADETADAHLIAVEMLAQAEHDTDAAAVVVVVGDVGSDAEQMCNAIESALVLMLDEQPRALIIRSAIALRGAILQARSLDEALRFAQEYAPEHLALMIADPRAALARVRNAGTIFLGGSSSVAFGDYMTGANHVLPTNRLSRSYSGLATVDFMRFVTYQEISPAGAQSLAAATVTLANAEGLPAHALAASMRAAASDDSREVRKAAPVRTRPAYRGIDLYEPGRTPCEIDLSDNTNLHGVPPAARASLESPAPHLVTRYPTVYGRDLKAALARRHGVEPDNIATGCGSDDILDSLLRAFCDAGDAVAFPVPTFGVVELFAHMNSARAHRVPHNSAGQLDVNALVESRAAVTYVCNPNNPTGTQYDARDIETLATSLRGVLAIDEAYGEYSGESSVGLTLTTGKTIVVKTFSKAFGLAGLRVGYAIADATLIREVEKARGPYKVGGLVEHAACTALAHDTAWVDGHVDEIRANRERLTTVLAGLGMPPLPSRANFVLVPVAGRGMAVRWAASLRAMGIAVRAFTDLPGTGDAIRVTIGPWPLMERFVNAIRTIRDSEMAVEAAIR